MINRVLIRIKVVQLLYSYLLVDNRFNLESQPESPTREKRYAYSLYLEMLALMAGIASGITRRGGDSPLYDTRFIRRVTTDERVKNLMINNATGNSIFSDVEKNLTSKIKDSGLYKKFLKSESAASAGDEKIWQELFNTVILPDPMLKNVISTMDNYSLSGVEKMSELMDSTFSSFYASSDHLPDALRTLEKSMEKARELYFRLLNLPVLLTTLRDSDIDEQRSRFTTSAEDRNPNMRFVENELVAYLRHSDELEAALNKYGVSMTLDDEPMLRSLLRAILASDIYKEYMEFPATYFDRDCDFWRNIFKNVIFENPDFLEALEEKSVFWNDDLDIIGTFVLKTIRRIAEHNNPDFNKEGSGESTNIGDLYPVNDAEVFLPMFKDAEDARFGADLFSAVVRNKDEYRAIIDEALDKSLWEPDRIAYMDVVVMLTAIAELLNFPKIPYKVTLNEYIEIAKCYSTAKSGQFVHALLSVIIKNLKADGTLLK